MKVLIESVIPAQPCPACEAELTRAAEAGGEGGPPSEGDLTICFTCTTVLEFGPDLILHPCPPEKVPRRVKMMIAQLRKARGDLH